MNVAGDAVARKRETRYGMQLAASQHILNLLALRPSLELIFPSGNKVRFCPNWLTSSLADDVRMASADMYLLVLLLAAASTWLLCSTYTGSLSSTGTFSPLQRPLSTTPSILPTLYSSRPVGHLQQRSSSQSTRARPTSSHSILRGVVRS